MLKADSLLTRGQIIQTLGLNPSTVNYVLREQNKSTIGVPACSGSGYHRKFTTDQAFQLAVFTTLVDEGFNFIKTEHIVQRINDIRKITNNDPSMTITILNRTWGLIFVEKRHEPICSFSIDQNNDTPPENVTTELVIKLNALQRRLNG